MTEVSCQLMWLVYLKADCVKKMTNSYAVEGFAMIRNDQAMRNDSMRHHMALPCMFYPPRVMGQGYALPHSGPPRVTCKV